MTHREPDHGSGRSLSLALLLHQSVEEKTALQCIWCNFVRQVIFGLLTNRLKSPKHIVASMPSTRNGPARGESHATGSIQLNLDVMNFN